MFVTMNYRHGWIHESHYPGCRPVFRAQAPHYRDLGEFKSLHAAKLALTRDYREVCKARADAAADHHRSIQSIVSGS